MIRYLQISKKLPFVVFYLSILFFVVCFNFKDSPPPSNWYQQFMPNIGGRLIADIFFLDSLTGWAVTPYVTQNDSVFVLKTTNGGDNWFKAYSAGGQYVGMNRIQFFDQNTGISCGVGLFDGSTGINKTINGGISWFSVNEPVTFLTYNDISVLNIDTIWVAASSNPTGGVFRTTNGGASWTQQLSLGSQNPNHIYFYNGRMGFTGRDNIYLRRTTDSGLNWTLINGAGGFLDMYFADSLTGWKTSFQKTTDGGLNWINQPLPQGGDIVLSQINHFSNIGSDTIWGVGGYVFWPGFGNRGMIFRTTNSGANWLFQVPDTNINIGRYLYTKFTGKLNGWAYSTIPTGIHTTSGGDPVFYTSVHQISLEVPKHFGLFQNYPNPFNPVTKIRYQIAKSSYVSLKVYNILGENIAALVNQKQSAGTYEVDFSASGGGLNLSSGVYFYKIEITTDPRSGIGKEEYTETKKMILVK